MSETFIKEMTKDDIIEMLLDAELSAITAGFNSHEAMENFKVDASLGMIKFGGSFTHNLGHALASADSKNTAKILRAFSDDCTHHAGLYRKWVGNRQKEEGGASDE